MHAVLVNRADEAGRLPAVVSDDRLAMKLAVDHLVRAGHRRIAHLAGPQNVPTGVGAAPGLRAGAARPRHSRRPASPNATATAARPAARPWRALLRGRTSSARRRGLLQRPGGARRLRRAARRRACASRTTSRSPATTTCRWSTWSIRRSPPSACRTASSAGARRELLFDALERHGAVGVHRGAAARAGGARASTRAAVRRRRVALLGQRALEGLSLGSESNAHALRRQVDLDLAWGRPLAPFGSPCARSGRRSWWGASVRSWMARSWDRTLDLATVARSSHAAGA